MIVGTAGHIDHGKTTLIRALTGVDTDRLPEEKKRGITIELGYAFLGDIGFVDVPGHERLVHTMLAGATGMDAAMLLVAADDGVMPQTCEHLAVLSLLGIQRGAVVITKSDAVESAQIQQVVLQIKELIAPTTLHAAPIFTVSAHTGMGMNALRDWLQQIAAQRLPHPNRERAFRIAVDRIFTLGGSGTVVTGTVHAGSVRVGDTLQLAPDANATRVRVRSIHAQNRPVEIAHAGQRCALALVGVGKDDIARGQWLVQPAIALQTDRLDVRLYPLAGEKPLRSGTPVHIHHGAAGVMGTVAVLDTHRVQLVLREPIAAWHGDRIVLRDASASRTIAGATVLDPFAPVRYRRTPQRLAELAALNHADTATRLAALLDISPNGVDVQRFHIAAGLLPRLEGEGRGEGNVLIAPHFAEQAAAQTLTALQTYHAKHPEELGPDSARLRRLALPRWSEALWQNLLSDLRTTEHIAVRGAFVHLPEHGLHLSATEERIAQKIMPNLLAARYEGAWVRDMAKNAAEPEPLVRVTLARLAQRGDLYQVVKDLYYPPATMHDCAAKVRAIAAEHDGAVLAAQFRDATGLGRKRAIQILEYLDRIGLLRRVGDVHKLRTDCQLFG